MPPPCASVRFKFVPASESATAAAPAAFAAGYRVRCRRELRRSCGRAQRQRRPFEQLRTADAQRLQSLSSPALGTSSSWQLPNDGTPLVIPNYADMSKVSVGAAVAVPVVHGLTLNLNYGTERMFGGYGLPGLTNLDATDNSYGGKLTFEMPHSSSTLSISAQFAAISGQHLAGEHVHANSRGRELYRQILAGLR